MLQVSLTSLQLRAAEYSTQLKQLTESTLADAEAVLTNIPEKIEKVKAERQER